MNTVSERIAVDAPGRAAALDRSTADVMGAECRRTLPPEDAPGERWSHGLDWPTIVWIAVVHTAALAAPLCFTWKGLAVFFILSWVTGGLGVCLGYHRLLSHLSFQTSRLLRRLIAIFGALAGQGPPATWIAVHRKHHQYTDVPGDPHSPRDGAWWSHVLWLFPRPREPQWTSMIQRYGKDLLKDPFMRLLEKTYLVWHFALGAALLAAGWWGWGLATGLSFLIWGMFVRLVWVMHVTWLVNSASHIWGYRNYQTPDGSRNLWWVALLTCGEGWHNNHHAAAHCARHGHRWWEFDMTYGLICLLERLGLAWDVARGRPPLH